MSTDSDNSAETVIERPRRLQIELQLLKEIDKRELIIKNQAIAIESLQILNNVLSYNSIKFVHGTNYHLN